MNMTSVYDERHHYIPTTLGVSKEGEHHVISQRYLIQRDADCPFSVRQKALRVRRRRPAVILRIIAL